MSLSLLTWLGHDWRWIALGRLSTNLPFSNLLIGLSVALLRRIPSWLAPRVREMLAVTSLSFFYYYYYYIYTILLDFFFFFFFWARAGKSSINPRHWSRKSATLDDYTFWLMIFSIIPRRWESELRPLKTTQGGRQSNAKETLSTLSILLRVIEIWPVGSDQ